MNKDDYISWRNDPRTEEYLESVLSEADVIIADLINTAGNNSLVDRYRAGVIQGLRYLADWQPVFDKEEEETEEDES